MKPHGQSTIKKIESIESQSLVNHVESGLPSWLIEAAFVCYLLQAVLNWAPLAMSLMLDDTTTVKILQCIAVGAFAAVVLIIFILPGLLATFDRFVVGKQKH